jgi:NAD(P)-dependent dehydrogenase (short-subunit alcohol dehydrogenase family)
MVAHLEGKVAIVSGAGSSGPGVGVGKATSVLFAQEGARLVLVDKFEDRAQQTLQMVKDAGGQGVVIVADITDPVECERIADKAVMQFDTIDILVNNAAISPLVGLVDTEPEVYARIMAVNVTGPFMLSKAVIPVMMTGGGGAIANITSIAAIRGTGVPETAYAASKAALLGMMVSVACAYGPQGIRINSIAPGHIDTPMRTLAAEEAGIDIKALDFSRRTALGIEGNAWDIARAALFLCSSDARYITGVHLPVDGGASVMTPG